MSCLSQTFATDHLFLPTRNCRAAQTSWLDNPYCNAARRTSSRLAITTKLAMNILTRARMFQDPFQSRKDINIILARSIVRSAPVNVLDVKRTSSHDQSLVELCVAGQRIYRAHTGEHMRDTTPKQPFHIRSRTQTTPDERTHDDARQADFRWRHLRVTASIRVCNIGFHRSNRAHVGDRPWNPPPSQEGRRSSQ